MPLPPLDAPTARPAEPLTAGAPIGNGPGPEAMGMLGDGVDDLAEQLRALYLAHPRPEIRALLEELDDQ